MSKKIIITTVVILILLELFAGLFLNIYTRLNKGLKSDVSLVNYWEFDPYLLWIPRPSVKGFDSYSSFKMNNRALRNDYDVSEEKKPGVFRIVVLGGSVAWGTGATTNKTVWTAVLEGMLSKNNQQVEVLNAACSGYISFQELIYLQFKLLSLSPDLVIVFDGYNDMFMSSLYSQKDYIRDTSPYYLVEKNFYKQPLFVQIAGLIKEKSNFFKLLKRINEKILYENGKPLYNVRYLNRDGISAYFENIKSISDILKGRGIKALFLLQPYLPESGKRLSSQEKIMLQKAKYEAPVIKDMLSILRREYKNFAIKEKIIFFDLNDIFDEISPEENVWHDHVHLNDLGQKTLAERLSKIIDSYYLNR